jgi:hypothetical protein
MHAAVDHHTSVVPLFDRLVRQERESIRLAARLLPKPSFDEVFELYRESGFLYPAKLAALEAEMPSIERTWKRALASDTTTFRTVARYGLVSGQIRLRNAASAFAYAAGTWQLQHLVSRERHEYTGTLAVMMELVEALHHDEGSYIRWSFRPNNPGIERLFGAVPQRLGAKYCHLGLCDYGCVPFERLRLPPVRPTEITVKPLASDEGAAAAAFYQRILHPVELASLALQDPQLRQVDPAYQAAGLARRRRVLLAIDHGEVQGACLVHDTSPGLNFSFLENAIEHLRVRPGLSTLRRTEVWTALASAAAEDARARADKVVVALAPGDRDISVASGMIAAEQPRQYAVLTLSRESHSYLRLLDCFVEYYRGLLSAEATR